MIIKHLENKIYHTYRHKLQRLTVSNYILP